MKKNLLSFIGSLLGVSSLFFLSTPYMNYIYNNKTTEYKIESLMGVPQYTEGYGYSSGFSMTGLLLLASILVSVISLIIVISNVIENKKRSSVLFAMSFINIFAIYFVAKYLSAFLKSSSSSGYSTYYYTIGWGIVIVICLLFAEFVLMTIQFIMDAVALKKQSTDSKYDEIYRFKKLCDDGIITKEDYEAKKKEFLENMQK